MGGSPKRTETFDDMPMNASDPRFDVFYDFEEYLRHTFPILYVSCYPKANLPSHKAMKFERVNTHGLLFTWQGSDPSLKPIVCVTHG